MLKVITAQIGEDSLLRQMAIEKVFEKIDHYQTEKAIARDECLTEDQVQSIIAAAYTRKTELMIRFLFVTGCRVSEMRNIRLSDCEPKNGYVTIPLMGKGKKERSVYIPTELYSNIREAYQGQVYLFETSGGRQLRRNNVWLQVRKAGKRAGYPDLHPHMLRHSRATDMLLNKEISLKAVSRYLGHSSTAITSDLYVHDQVDPHALFAKDRAY